MPLEGSYGNTRFRHIEGYKISACLHSAEGFKDSFRVYILDREDAKESFDEVDLGPPGGRRRGELAFSDTDRNYTFKQIDLWDVDYAITRREKFRLTEFRYEGAVIDEQSGAPLVTLKNKSKERLAPGAHGDNYKYSIDPGQAEDLLGFAAWLRPTSATMMRFESLRNNQNSFLEKLVGINPKAGNGEFKGFTVHFSKGEIPVRRENLVRAYVDESFGELRDRALPSWSAVEDPRMIATDVGAAPDTLMPRVLLEHDDKRDITKLSETKRTVESATFVFNAGEFRNIKIT
jgi:hypothetical protein